MSNLRLYYCFDITQVKYDNLICDEDGVVRQLPDPRDMNLTPTVNRCVRMQWDVDGVALKTLQRCNAIVNQSFVNLGWSLELSWWNDSTLRIAPSRSMMPIAAQDWYEEIKVTVKLCINGTNQEITKTIGSGYGVHFDLCRDDIVEERCLCLDITLEVAREDTQHEVTDYWVEVERADWEKYGII